MKKLVTAADKARGDLEEEYRLLMKAGEVSSIISKHPKRNEWNVRVLLDNESTCLKTNLQKADALMMKTDADRVLDRLSNLQTLLNKVEHLNNTSKEVKKNCWKFQKYDAIKYRQDHMERAASQEAADKKQGWSVNQSLDYLEKHLQHRGQ